MRRWGYEQLVQRADALKFLKPMIELGFFEPEENPGPIPGDTQGSYRILRWDAMIYLEKAAADAGTREDLAAAEQIMGVVRAISKHKSLEGEPTDNPGTWHSLAKITAALPTASYSAGDLRLLRLWLDSKFDRGMMIGVVLGKELLPKLLSSQKAEDVDKANVVIDEATRLVWRSRPNALEKNEANTVVDPYWLQKLFEKHSKALGAKCSPAVVELLLERVTELFTRTAEDKHSWLLRPAIEDHSQNHDFRSTHNVLINALRDTLLSYVDARPAAATPFVEQMLSSLDINKRIAIHVIDERFQALAPIFEAHLHDLLRLTLVHETYRLLQRQFGTMPDTMQASVLEAIEGMEASTSDPEAKTRFQARLLHAAHGKGNAAADSLHRELSKTVDWGKEDRHPDFLSYMTSWTGPGPSPYSVEQLKAMDDDTLIQTLNGFEQAKGWRDPHVPSVKALCDVVSQGIKENPGRFCLLLSRLDQLKPSYQYALLNGFRDLSHSGTPTEKAAQFDWPGFWKLLFDSLSATVLAKILSAPEEEEEVEALTPTRHWLVPVIADLIRNGTHDDYRAIPVPLFPLVRNVIGYTLSEEESTAEGRESDAMNEAINTTKGHCIEALVDFALYACRTADRQKKDHQEEWNSVKELFDSEITKCKDGNFEFSTLCGAYLANIHYLSAEWLEQHVDDIFPKDVPFARNFDCALQGFAYMPQPTKATYQLLRRKGILHAAIGHSTKGRYVREKLIQHICVAYLWGDEPLDSADSLMGAFLKAFEPLDMHEMTRFFWSLQRDQLSAEQVQKILAYWKTCMQRVEPARQEHRPALSDLGLLAAFLKDIPEEVEKWLLTIAPTIGTNHNTDFFIEYMERLADTSPRQVGEIVLAVVKSDRPYYDFENRYESIIKKLLAGPHHKLGEELCSQPGLIDLAPVSKIYGEFRASRQKQ